MDLTGPLVASPSLPRGATLVEPATGSLTESDPLPPRYQLVSTLLQALALYNTIELFIIISFTFKQRGGTYFWSLVLSNAGVAVVAVACVFHDYAVTTLATRRVAVGMMTLAGWTPMVIGQLFILYSRLHLLYLGRAELRRVLAIITTVAVVCCVPAWVLIIGSNAPTPTAARFQFPCEIQHRFQTTVFFLAEGGLSLLYLWKCYGFWVEKSMRAVGAIRSLLLRLMMINVLVLALDTSLLYTGWSGRHTFEISYKAFVYSVKLKIEIHVLTRLVTFVEQKRRVDYRSRAAQQMEEEWTRTLDIMTGASSRQGPRRSEVQSGVSDTCSHPSCPRAAGLDPPAMVRMTSHGSGLCVERRQASVSTTASACAARDPVAVSVGTVGREAEVINERHGAAN